MHAHAYGQADVTTGVVIGIMDREAGMEKQNQKPCEICAKPMAGNASLLFVRLQTGTEQPSLARTAE
jgi:hypothetical protein